MKIPNVCIGLTMRYITPFEMLRIERARFIWANRVPLRRLRPQQRQLTNPMGDMEKSIDETEAGDESRT